MKRQCQLRGTENLSKNSPENARKSPRGSCGGFSVDPVVKWLRLPASITVDVGLIPGWGTKIPQSTQHDQNVGKKRRRNCDAGWITSITLKKTWFVILVCMQPCLCLIL